MAIVDTRNRSFSVSIVAADAGLTVVDVTDYVVSGALAYDALSESGVVGLSGDLSLAGRILSGYLADPWDDLSSPKGREIFAPGNQVSISIADSNGVLQPLPPLYIGGIPTPSQPSGSGELSELSLRLVDRLALGQESDDPPGDESGIDLGSTTDRTTIIGRLITASEAGVYAGAIADYPLSAPLPKVQPGSYISQAGAIAITAGHTLYENVAGAIGSKAIAFPLTGSADFAVAASPADIAANPTATRAALYERQTQEDRPPDEAIASGTGYAVSPVPNPRVTTTRKYDFKGSISPIAATLEGAGENEKTLSYYEEVTETINAYNRVIETVIREPKAVVLVVAVQGVLATDPVNYFERIITSSKTETWNYSPIDGRLLNKRTTISKPKAAVIDPLVISGGDYYVLTTATTITETYSYNSVHDFVDEIETRTTGVRGQIKQATTYEGDATEAQQLEDCVVELRTQRWQRRAKDDFEYSDRTLVPIGLLKPNRAYSDPYALTEDIDRSVKIRSNAGQAQPPATEFKPELQDKQEQLYEGNAQYSRPRGAAAKRRLLPIDLPGGLAVSDAQCVALASLWGKWAHGKAHTRFVGCPVPDDWLTNPVPLPLVDIHESGATYRVIADGIRLQWDRESLAFAFAGVEVGKVVGGAVVPAFVELSSLNTVAESVHQLGSIVDLLDYPLVTATGSVHALSSDPPVAPEEDMPQGTYSFTSPGTEEGIAVIRRRADNTWQLVPGGELSPGTHYTLGGSIDISALINESGQIGIYAIVPFDIDNSYGTTTYFYRSGTPSITSQSPGVAYIKVVAVSPSGSYTDSRGFSRTISSALSIERAGQTAVFAFA